MEQYTFITFLITCITALALFIRYLVVKIIALTSDCSSTMKDVRNAVTNNTEAIKELRTTILTLNK